MQQDVPDGYKLTEVGVIPEDWEVKPASEIFIKIQDGTHFSPKVGGNDFLYVTSKNIRIGRLELHTAEYIDEKQHKSIYKRCDVRKGDILLTKDGANTGNAALNTLDEEFSLLSSVAFLRVDAARHSAEFYLQQIISPIFQQAIHVAMSGNAITRLTLDKINKLIFIVPGRKEQKAIANTLSNVDTLITSLEKLIAKKRAIKTATMQQLLIGKKRLPPFDKSHTGYKQTELGEIPEDWQVHQFGLCVKNFQLGGNYKNGDIDSGVPLVKMGNIARGYISLKKVEYVPKNQDVSEKDRCHYDDIYFNTRNTLDLVGKVSIWSDELPRAYFNSNLMRVTFNNENVSSNRFMNYLMNSKYFIDALADIAIGTTSVAAIYTRDLVGLKIILPPCEEQKAIANVLLSMDHEIKRLEQQLHKTQQLKQGMMQELLTGKTRLIAGTA